MSLIRRKKHVLPFVGAAAIMIVLSAAWTRPEKKMRYHSDEELLKILMVNETDLPVGDNGVFIGSGKCGGCHGIDHDSTNLPLANVDSEGTMVNPTENWRATMMANSARDPLWRAKVAHEVAVNPEHQEELETKCTSCHSPVGRYTAQYNGQDHYSIAEMIEDSLAMDGVNCGACHQQRMENLGNHFSGDLFFHSDTVWGPYVSEELDFPIFASAMTSFVGYEPVGDHKVSQSEMCAGCHTLLTNSVDLDGELTGSQFVEQATYHEWLNSAYNETEGFIQECQGCHMPRLNEPIIIASGYSFLPGREPYGQHWLVGGNTFMLELMKNNITTLGITATEEHFNTVIQRTYDQLQYETATLQLTEGEVDGDTARYTVKLTNLAGHKFPSGYPARRAYVEFIVTDSEGEEIFHSGRMNNQYYIEGEPLDAYEPHYDLIRDEDEVQIYEMVMGDVDGNITTVLERAHQMLKDNRLVPLGFSVNHSAYDTTAIVGTASIDPNFNYVNGVEGSGTDEIRFHVPVTGVNGAIQVQARLMYQTVPPRYTTEMFSVDDPTINLFEGMYWAEGADPVVVASDDVTSTVVGVGEFSFEPSVSPNPTSDGRVWVNGGQDVVTSVRVYTASGQQVAVTNERGRRIQVILPETPGNYLLEIRTTRGRYVEKVLRR